MQGCVGKTLSGAEIGDVSGRENRVGKKTSETDSMRETLCVSGGIL